MSDKFEITGVVHAIPKARNDKYASFVLLVPDGKYPQYVPFEHKTDTISAPSIGDEVKVTFNVRGREWTSPQGEVKYFGTLSAWKVEVTKRSEYHAPAPTFEDPIPF